MRQKLELPEYEPYSEDNSVLRDPFVADFSEQVLKSEQNMLSEESYHEDVRADIAFLGQLATRKWWKTAIPPKEDIQTWAQKRYGVSTPGEAIVEAKDAEQRSEEQAGKYRKYMRDDLDYARDRIKEMPEIEQKLLSDKIDRQLDIFAVANGIEPQNLAFRQWKKYAEQTEGHTMSWTEWMARPTDAKEGELSTTDRQLLNFLQWNQHHYNAMNMDKEFDKELQKMRTMFGDGLFAAVQSGKLTPELLDHYLSRPQIVLVGDVLDEMLFAADAYTGKDKNEIIVTFPVSPQTYVHERTHKLGDLKDSFWTECATQLIADIIDEENGLPKHESGYAPGVDILRELMDMSGVSTAEMSSYYAKSDLNGFLDRMGSKLGVDLNAVYSGLKERIYTIADSSYAMQELTQGYMKLYLEELKAQRQ